MSVYPTNSVKSRRSFILILITVHQNKIHFASFGVFSAVMMMLPFSGIRRRVIWYLVSDLSRQRRGDQKVKQNLDFSTPEEETTMLSGNIMNQITRNAVFYLKRTDTKSTLSFTHPTDPANTAYLREFTVPLAYYTYRTSTPLHIHNKLTEVAHYILSVPELHKSRPIEDCE